VVRIASGILPAAALVLAGCGGGADGGVTAPPSSSVTVADVQGAIFTPHCAVSGCHVSPGAPFGLDLSGASVSAANTIGVASSEVPSFLRVEPGNPADSYLYMKVTGDPRILGDRMPVYAQPLNAADLDLIVRWIDGGAR
jgi:hypothetical protein